MRPKAIKRWLFHKDTRLRKAIFCYNNIEKRVFFFELYQFFFVNKRTKKPTPTKDFWK